jgi:hypothetical protein
VKTRARGCGTRAKRRTQNYEGTVIDEGMFAAVRSHQESPARDPVSGRSGNAVRSTTHDVSRVEGTSEALLPDEVIEEQASIDMASDDNVCHGNMQR